MKRHVIPVIAFFVFLLASCGSDSYGLAEFIFRANSVEDRADSVFNLGNVAPASGKVYSVLIISDVHFGGENSGKNGSRKDLGFLNWMKDLKQQTTAAGTPELYPSFAICLGDVAEHGEESEFLAYQLFTEKLKTDEFGNIVTYNVVGNHDLYNSGWNRFKVHCYPYTSFYKFRTDSLTWYFLDSAGCTLGDDQLTSLSRDMKYVEKGRKKLLFMHVPVYAEGLFYFSMQEADERNRFISLLGEEDAIALVDGHTHQEHVSNLGFIEYNIPGYLEKRAFAIMYIDERNSKYPTVSVKCYYPNF
mgnify:FL=1